LPAGVSSPPEKYGIGGSIKRGFTVYILKPGEYQKIQSGEFIEIGRGDDGSLLVSDNDPTVVTAIPGTQWKVADMMQLNTDVCWRTS
jgi:hypothetical protein